MDTELLVVPGRPHQQPAEKRLREVLAAPVLDADFNTRVISDEAEAERSGFTSSPTVRIDGRDPSAEPDARPSLSCRIYRTPQAPLPSASSAKPSKQPLMGRPTS
ncbi:MULTISPECIES: hypothetical protein [Streptomyces]|uniref:hypothetical protein n=1 Tax=Streptomyces TaxID=1883 RepID=UPI000241B36D|nr:MULTISPECIES: hypothetical protein [Streptomyces]EHM25151.1 hypothetical protein SPW_6476 [Streptomyces sp. W007]MCX4486178.1 hypothetical protein [Streptomyces anulatus]WTD26590.1 hypothetical protein OH737_19525 [Streptomyces anulatus]